MDMYFSMYSHKVTDVGPTNKIDTVIVYLNNPSSTQPEMAGNVLLNWATLFSKFFSSKQAEAFIPFLRLFLWFSYRNLFIIVIVCVSNSNLRLINCHRLWL